jgi:two-component system LytT family sensor kinase
MTFRLQNLLITNRNTDGILFLRHLIAWAVFIAYEITFVRFNGGVSSPFRDYVCYYALNIGLFYSNAHLLLNWAINRRRRYLVIPFGLIVEMAVYLSLKFLLDRWLAFPQSGKMAELSYIRRLLLPNIYRGIYFLGFSTLYWSVLRMIFFQHLVYKTEKLQLTTQKENAELGRDLAEARNAYLQHQINPHLLFNTLTFIHNSYYKYSPEASQCILLLVDIMRYSLDAPDPDGKTPLDEEAVQIQNFIELNRVRFDFELYVEFQQQGDLASAKIIPLILLTLTENVFKHGNLKIGGNKARLLLTLTDEHLLRFETWNVKSDKSSRERRRSIGLKNVIKRLEYSYRDDYTIEITDLDDSYGLKLTVQL